MKSVIINMPLTDLNTYVNAERANRFKGAKIKKEMTELCSVFFIGKKYKTPISLKFIWYLANKRKDPDNVAFAKKFILDGMVRAGAIPNDNMANISHFDGDFFEVNSNQCEGVEIFIKELTR